MSDKKIHEGHRQRLKNRFIRLGGLEGFEDHQVLELLLFYAIPRRDTNEIAHKLINEFGSLGRVFAASPEDIEESCHVSTNTAVLISLVSHIARKYLAEINNTGEPVTSKSIAFNIIEPYFAGAKRESLYLMCLDAGFRLIRVECVSKGNAANAPIELPRIVELALKNSSVFAIIVHNHPGGSLKPSKADISATFTIKKAFEMVSINLIDHIIVSDGECYSFAQNKLCSMSY